MDVVIDWQISEECCCAGAFSRFGKQQTQKRKTQCADVHYVFFSLSLNRNLCHSFSVCLFVLLFGRQNLITFSKSNDAGRISVLNIPSSSWRRRQIIIFSKKNSKRSDRNSRQLTTKDFFAKSQNQNWNVNLSPGNRIQSSGWSFQLKFWRRNSDSTDSTTPPRARARVLSTSSSRTAWASPSRLGQEVQSKIRYLSGR